MQLNSKTSENLRLFSCDDLRAHEEVIDYMVRAELLLTYIEKYDFPRMVQRTFNPQFKGFSSSMVKRDITKKMQRSEIFLKKL